MSNIVFIHGLWMTPRSWEKWAEHYTAKGHNVLAPAWPGLEVEVEELNRDPSPLKRLDIPTIVDHYENVIRGLDSPPIIFGHSLGGTITQLLIDRGLGAAGVGIAPGSVKGVLDLPLSTIRATMPALRNPFGAGDASPLNRKQFHYAFANTLSQEESDAIYDRYHVPCANRVLMQTAFQNLTPKPTTKVDFAKPDRAPLAFFAFEHDHIIPPKLALHTSQKYKSGVVAYREFKGRPHFPGAPGWEEVADYAIEWAANPRPGE